MEKLGILAGNGAMPKEVVDYCKATGRDFFVVGLEPHVLPETVQDTPHVLAKIGEIGKILKNFQKNEVKEIVFAGGVRRPTLKELIPDWEGAKLMTKFAIRRMTDDDIFRVLINEIETKGFKVVGAQEVIPQMMLLEGACGKTKPSKEDLEDIQTGIKVAKALGALDVGQACVVQESMILAVEAKEGTDTMMDRIPAVKRSGKAPILVKVVKPGQETRVDLPTIGPRTIETLKRNGIKGMAVEIGGTLLLEREKTVKMADDAKIFIVGVRL
jgi:DUF1009 family protein